MTGVNEENVGPRRVKTIEEMERRLQERRPPMDRSMSILIYLLFLGFSWNSTSKAKKTAGATGILKNASVNASGSLHCF